jgi:selenocysteine lyase/cysteine desulfurase
MTDAARTGGHGPGTASEPPSGALAPFRGLIEAEFPWAAQAVFLNTAGIGPLPARTRRVLEEWARLKAAPHELPEKLLGATLAESRRIAARLVNADPAEIALATNTSFGINLAARALPIAPGEIVLVSDREFPANVYPWMALRERGVVFELAPTTPEGWPDEERLLERVRDPRVRVLAVSLTQFANGYTVDLARLSEATRATGAFLVVDAIQGVGQMPVDVRATPVDVLSCGAQKWLLSPWGSGFVYVRRELVSRLSPADVGWLAFEGTDDFTNLTRYDTTLRSDARRFELVTLPFQDFAGMNASLGLLLEIGIERIRDHLREVCAPVLEWAARSGAPLTSPVGPRGSAMLCLALPDPAAAYRLLRSEGIFATVREGVLRMSPHLYNTPDDLARVAELLDRAR